MYVVTNISLEILAPIILIALMDSTATLLAKDWELVLFALVLINALLAYTVEAHARIQLEPIRLAFYLRLVLLDTLALEENVKLHSLKLLGVSA